MSNEDLRYPLHWPDGWARTPPDERMKARYKVSEHQAFREMLDSLRLLGATNVIVSTNVQLRRDGLPYANQKAPDDPGVAVYYQRNGIEESIACDVWRTVGDNYRGLGQTVDGLRQIERSGSSAILERAFRGFAALPPAASEPWRAVLIFAPNEPVTKEDVLAMFRTLARAAHPDNGGSADEFCRLVAARDAALAELSHGT